jgi:hypothetical protein
VQQARRLSDAEYLRRYELERADAVASHAQGTDVGKTHLDNPRLWAQVYDDGGHRTSWLRYMGWVQYCYGPVHLQVMNPDGTWRPWLPRCAGRQRAPCDAVRRGNARPVTLASRPIVRPRRR